MNKKIIILNGSPRLKGNTAGLIDAFVQGAEQAGHPALDEARQLGLSIR